MSVGIARMCGALAVLLTCLGTGSAAAEARARPRPRVFLMCPEDCFDSFLRQELAYFEMVRDPLVAELSLLIVRHPAGNGGIRFSVTASRVGPAGTTTSEVTRSVVTDPGASAHDMRTRLLQVVLRTLHGELIGTEHESAFALTLTPATDVDARLATDPWRSWVFAPELRGNSDGASGNAYAELTGALTVRRITLASKFRLTGYYARTLTAFRLEDGSRVRGDVYSYEARALHAQALNEHVSLGAMVVGRGNEFENIRGHVRVAAVGEVNVFPFSQNARRQLRFAYQAGSWSSFYIEETVHQRFREHRPFHALSMVADVNQPWGSVQWIGQVNSFLDAPKQYRVSSGANVTLRLVTGLAITLEGEVSYVKDLINLRGRSVTDLELLLWTVQQPTRYLFDVSVALTYTFGSVHNTVVNPRFGRIDLTED